jgi:hypothetical protein
MFFLFCFRFLAVSVFQKFDAADCSNFPTVADDVFDQQRSRSQMKRRGRSVTIDGDSALSRQMSDRTRSNVTAM